MNKAVPNTMYIKQVGIFLIWLLLVACFSARTFGQSAKNPWLDDQYVFQMWDNKTGLPQNTVFDIASDAKGYLWIATEEGLVRFDGSKFKTINSESTPQLDSSIFYDLSESITGRVWAASRYTVSLVGNNSVQTVDFSDHLRGAWLTSIVEDNDGTLWAGTNDGSLYLFQGGTVRKFNEWDSTEITAIQVMVKVPDGLIIGTSAGLFKLNTDSQELNSIHELASMDIRALEVNNQSSIVWVGTAQNGLFNIQNDNITHYTEADGLAESFILSLAVNAAGHLWIGTSSSGLQIYRNGEFVRPEEEAIAERQDIKSIHIKGEDVVWLGTSGSGLIQMKLAAINVLSQKHGLSGNIILPVYEHKNGDIWLGTAGKGLNRIIEGRIEHYTRRDGLANEIVLTVYGTEDAVYIGTASGLNRFNLHTERIDRLYTVEDGLASNIIQAVFQDSNHRLWIATRSGGIHWLNRNGRIEKLELPISFRGAKFISIFEDRNNVIWVGSEGSGMISIDKSLTVASYPAGEEFPFDVVYSFYEDNKGELWLGTSRGLVRFDDRVLQVYGVKDGLRFDDIYNIISDGDYLWLSGNMGMQRIPLNELEQLKAAKENNGDLQVRLFGTEDGMANFEANGVIFPAGWKMSNGSLWFPTVEGVAIVQPSSIGKVEDPLDIRIEAIRHSNREYTLPQDVAVPPGVYSIEIDYAAIDFDKPQMTNFHYRLNSWQEWERVGNRRTAYFTELQPGEYTFEVMAEKYGEWAEPVKMSFSVSPFFYQTYWFKSFLLMVLFGAGFVVKQFQSRYKQESMLKTLVDVRTRELQDALGEKDVLIKEVHHRVKNNLAVITGMLYLQAFNNPNKELENKLLDSVSRIKSIALIHEYLYQGSSLTQIEVSDNIREVIQKIQETFSFETEVEYDLELQPVTLNVNQAVPFALIINELITNVYKHAFKGRSTGKVWVKLWETDQRVSLEVKDNGVGLPDGFNADDTDTLGMELIYTLAKQLAADVQLYTVEGTVFVMEFDKSEAIGSANSM